jgi:hypothetical protein
MEERKEGHVVTKMRHLTIWAASFFFSVAQQRLIVDYLGTDLQFNYQAEQGVLDGYPHWRLVQSRVLGPWLEEFLRVLFGFSLSQAHVIIAIAILTLSGVVMFQAGCAIGERQRGWSALLAFHVLFALLLSHPWLYIWDYFVLLVASVFMLLVIRGAPWWSFLLLMGVAFFNHDSALFIGVWMVAQGLAAAWAKRRRPDWGMVVGGVFGSLGGILLIEYLRRSLLKEEIGWKLFRHLEPPNLLEPYYFFLRLPDNLNDILQWMIHPHSNFLFVIPLPLVLALALAVILVVRHGIKAAPLAIYAVAQVAALLLFAIISETRDLLQLVPFLCLAGMLAAKPDWETA